MENMINFFEIPASDFSRAIGFYKAVLSVDIHEMEMFGTKMGFLPSDGKNVSGAIVQGEDYTPARQGTLIYLNGGHDLQPMLDKVAQHNCKVVMPKTHISPDIGYCAMFIDTEGNKIAINSKN